MIIPFSLSLSPYKVKQPSHGSPSASIIINIKKTPFFISKLSHYLQQSKTIPTTPTLFHHQFLPMLLRKSISSTKSFFNKTLGNLKNLFSAGSYQKLPKSPAIYNAYSTSMSTSTTTAHVHDMNLHNTSSYKDYDKLYNDFTDQWDSKRQSNNKRLVISSPAKQGLKVVQRRDHEAADLNNKVMTKRVEESRTTISSELKAPKRGYLVAEKLKELEMLDLSNVDHVLDVQEAFHYYSRLTCPAYIEIVDRFFVEMCTEFFGPASTPGGSKKPRPRPRTSLRA